MGSDDTPVTETVPERLRLWLEQFEHEEFDVVAIGRALLADAQWVRKVLDGRLEELQEYIRPPRGERPY